jgi:hypothetical protein
MKKPKNLNKILLISGVAFVGSSWILHRNRMYNHPNDAQPKWDPIRVDNPVVVGANSIIMAVNPGG